MVSTECLCSMHGTKWVKKEWQNVDNSRITHHTQPFLTLFIDCSCITDKSFEVSKNDSFLMHGRKKTLSSALVAPAHLPPFKFALLYNPCPFYISTKPQPLPWRRRRTAAAGWWGGTAQAANLGTRQCSAPNEAYPCRDLGLRNGS